MHESANNFILFVKSILPDFFLNKIVLDVGGGDINGNNSYLFENCIYHVNDVIYAPNVTIISRTKDITFEPNSFDTIISSECFEHDPDYKLSFLKIYELLKPGGLFLFTCASTGRPEHGTRRTTPTDSYGTIGNIPDMIDYYYNLTIEDINDITSLDYVFSTWDSYYENNTHDLYFLGLKKDDNYNFKTLPIYKNIFVENTTSKLKMGEDTVEKIFL